MRPATTTCPATAAPLKHRHPEREKEVGPCGRHSNSSVDVPQLMRRTLSCPKSVGETSAKRMVSNDLYTYRYTSGGGNATTSWLCSAVITTVFTMSSTVQPRERSFTGLARPCMMGPTAMVFEACWTAL